jgi:hypothetical protein
MLGMEPRVLCELGKCFMTELQPLALLWNFLLIFLKYLLIHPSSSYLL